MGWACVCAVALVAFSAGTAVADEGHAVDAPRPLAAALGAALGSVVLPGAVALALYAHDPVHTGNITVPALLASPVGLGAAAGAHLSGGGDGAVLVAGLGGSVASAGSALVGGAAGFVAGLVVGPRGYGEVHEGALGGAALGVAMGLVVGGGAGAAAGAWVGDALIDPFEP